MSDALCGPSNSLQHFKEQTQLDRSLQQDRLASRASLQGFRTSDPLGGALDSEFEAFQAGASPSNLPSFRLPTPSHARIHNAPQTPSWAADFQQMRISSPMTAQNVYHSPESSARPFQQPSLRKTTQLQPPTTSSHQFHRTATYSDWTNTQQIFHNDIGHHKRKAQFSQPINETFDDAAFERAFDQAQQAMIVNTEATTESLHAANVAVDDYEAQNVHEVVTALDQHQVEPLMGTIDDILEPTIPQAQPLELIDSLQDEETVDRSKASEEYDQQKQQVDDDALAATAQELLAKVEHNQTEKFKNSQFLGLMRRLRDREVKVEGDKMVETPVSEALHASTSDPHFRVADDAPNVPFRRSPRTSPPEFDSHFDPSYTEHEYDHWESPFR